MRLAF
jgi:hypothetical protein